LRMFGVGEALEEAVSGAKNGEARLGAVDERREALVMALAGLAEEHGMDGASGEQSFLDEAGALDADEATLRGQAAVKSHAELFEPAIVAAGEERRFARRLGTASGFAGCSHSVEVNKFRLEGANLSGAIRADSTSPFWLDKIFGAHAVKPS